MRNTILLLLLPIAVFAQPTVAPTPESVGNPKGENTGGYNILNSFELGLRWNTVDGNYGKYRSDVNFGNGLRLLGSQLRVDSRDGHGKFFDNLSLTTLGLGNDPYESAVLRIEKNGIYRYDMNWRMNEYFNPALTIANGEHAFNTRRQLQDHDFTLFPQSNYKLFFGYSGNTQTGPALTTVQVFDSRGDEFPLFSNINRRRREFRLGGEAALFGFNLNVLHGWDHFRDETPIGLLTPREPGNNPLDNTTLSAFSRTEPYSGDSPYWRIALFRNARLFSLNARYNNVSGRRNFLLDESVIGTDRFASAANRQFVASGAGSRPLVSGSLNIILLPTTRLTISNHTAFNNTRMDGNARFVQVDNGAASETILNFQFLGIRAIETLTDATFALTSRIGLYGGYHYSNREIRSIEGQAFSGISDAFRVSRQNHLHAGLAGLRLRPLKPLTIQLDAEIGRADNPFFPISEKNYQALNGRVQYKWKSLLLSALTRTFYNTNSISLFAHSSRSRQYAFDMSWSPSAWLSFDAGYGKLHLDTLTGIAYFASSQLIDGNALYVSNLHSGNFGARLAIRKRADLYIGYSIVKDTGDGRSSYLLPNPSSPAQSAFYAAQTFPLTYQTPQARLSIKLYNRLRWNLGYQHYAYYEQFYPLTYQNYRAHTGYSSLLWSF
ncbi:MAG: hypothetical protein IT167_03250 [Bryobacterales bacterium]|nr:hypothetical protein [Bryobacterales bacterium]